MPPKKKKQGAKIKVDKKAEEEQRNKQLALNALGREIAYSQKTIQKHEKEWRKMLIDMALPRMRSELEYAWHNFERIMDSKDFMISLLMDDIHENEEQYLRNNKSHMDNIDNIIVVCYDQIQELRNDSKIVIQNLYRAATFERTDILGITKENEEYLKTMLYMLENEKKETEKWIRGEYLSREEVEISKLMEFCSKFTEELEGKFERMWKESTDFLKQNITECAKRRKEYYQLRKLDDNMQTIIKNLWEKIKKSLDQIKTMKDKYSDLEAIQSRKINELTNERNHFEHLYNVMKIRLEEDRKVDDEKLTFLTVKSNAIIKYLETWEVKGEKLLKLSGVCRKYETLEEKTMAFPLFNNPDIIKKFVEPEGVEGVRKDLQLFFNRLAKADTLRYEINEELEYFKIQNIDLKKKIHEYCQCLTCPGQITEFERDLKNVFTKNQ